MTYEKQIWKDRQVQYPNRYVDQNGNILQLERSPGTVTENGSLFNAEKMNHIENGIKAVDIANQTNTTNIKTNSKSIKGLKGEILWTNSNVMNEFNAQAIEVNLRNYDYYEMLFLQAFNIQRICSTNKLPTTFSTTLSITFNGKPWSRDVNIDGNMNVSIDNAYSFDTHGSSVKTQNNGALIPYQLIAYKIER